MNGSHRRLIRIHIISAHLNSESLTICLQLSEGWVSNHRRWYLDRSQKQHHQRLIKTRHEEKEEEEAALLRPTRESSSGGGRYLSESTATNFHIYDALGSHATNTSRKPTLRISYNTDFTCDKIIRVWPSCLYIHAVAMVTVLSTPFVNNNNGAFTTY